ncbi:hypothetical protein LUZ60_002116 [Juncus effusus]|nr:hypothetical protein LUZ60_002116 [Juncus effusus]
MQNPNQAPDQFGEYQSRRRGQYIPLPRKRKTHPTAWCLAAICTIFWVAIILGGLAVLIVYLVYKPKSPRFDIADATLNAGYLDMGTFLNADLTLLVNVVNPNHKLDMSFSYLQLDLYYQGIMIGTQIVDAFYQPRGQSSLRNVHIITSQVQMPLAVAQMWGNGTEPGGNGVRFQLRGKFLTRWLFGRWLHFTTWVRRGCAILVGPPPNGEILTKQCG